MKTVTIMVVASAGVIRDGYQALFGAIDGLCVLPPADDAQSALIRIGADKPEIIVVDSSVDDAGTRRVFAFIKELHLSTRTMVISSGESPLDEISKPIANVVVIEGTSPSDLASVVKQISNEIRNTEIGET